MQAKPRYAEIRQQLVNLLSQGHWRQGMAIDSERLLAARFGVAIGTLRRAVDELVADGLLVRRQGLGTFVNGHTPDRFMFSFFHIVRRHGPKQYPEVSLISFARDRAGPEAARALGLDAAAPVFRVRNLLSIAGIPAIVDDIVISARRFKGLSEATFRSRPSTIYALYQEQFGQTIARATERLQAVSAPRDLSQLLNLPVGAPMLKIRRLALGLHGDPIEWRVSHVQTENHDYQNDLIR